MSGRLTRRQLLSRSAAGATVLLLDGCGSGGGRAPARSGSTLESTWGDPVGDGQLRVLGGERFVARTELGSPYPMTRELARLAHVTDAHVLDASSPARVTFLDRLGSPFQSSFRPQEALTLPVFAGALRAVRALAPAVVIQGGDLIDNDQNNELNQALAALHGGRVTPGSGPHGYYGVQLESNPDPFYYRPDVDSPQHPGLLRDAVRPFVSVGVKRWLPVLGDHDILVAGEKIPDALTSSLAVGDRALWDLPPGLTLPRGLRLQASNSPDGPPSSNLVDQFLTEALQGPTVAVPADAARRELEADEVVSRLASAARTGSGASGRLDYIVDLNRSLRLIVLDVASRTGGSGGVVVDGQTAFVSDALAGADGRWVIFVSHQPLRDSVDGAAIRSVLDGSPRVIATLAGHTHRNRIEPRATTVGGYWEIETASLIDYPQQSRALRLHATSEGGVAIETWMLDHVGGGPVGTLGRISRELSYLDAEGGRPRGFSGERIDRNAVLYVRAR